MASGDFQFTASGRGGGTQSSPGFQFKAPKNDYNFSSLQALQLQELAKQEHGQSILSNIFHGGVTGVGWALDKLTRPAEAVASGALAGTKGEGFHLGPALHGAREGFMGREHATFSDVIRQEFPSWAHHHKVLTALGGLGADILTDPTLPLVVGAQFIPGVNVAVDVAEGARIASLIGKGATATERYKNARTAYKGLTDMGETFSANKTLAAHEAIAAKTEMRGGLTSLKDQESLTMAQESAKQELERNSQKVLQARYHIPFSRGKSIPLTPTTLAGKRVAPLAPSLLRTAGGAGVIGKVPGVAHAANTVGTLFKHGFGEEEFAKPALIAQHSQERLEGNYIGHAAEQFRPHRGLTEDDRLKALSFGEETPDIVQGRGRKLNEALVDKAVTHGRLTKGQAAFLRSWHTHMEYLRARDAEFGVKYEKEIGDKVYVPHIYTREGGVATQGAIKRATGFSKERKADLSLRELKNLGSHEAKRLNLEDDIMNILTHRTRKAAREHAYRTLLDHMRVSGGVIARVPDDAARQKILSRIDELKGKQNSIKLLDNIRGRRISMGRQVQVRAQKKLMEAVERHDKRLKASNAKIQQHYEGHLAKEGQARTPTWSRMSKMGAESLKRDTAHFSPNDKKLAKKLHSEHVELRRIRNAFSKLPQGSGGPQNQAKALAKEVEALTKRHQGRAYHGMEIKPAGRGVTWRGVIKSTLTGLEDSIRGDWQKLAEKYPNPRNIDHAKAVGRLVAAQERAVDSLAKEIDKIKENARIHKNQLEDEFAKEFELRVKQHEGFQKRIDRLGGLMDKKYMRNPDLPPDYIKYDKKLHDEHWYFKPEVHESMTRVERIMTDDSRMAGLGEASRKLLAMWKLGVTSINPGYRVRNTLSDLWNMYIAGVPIPQMVRYGTKAARMQVLAHSAGEKLLREGAQSLTNKEIAAVRMMGEMYTHGVLSGLFQGDIQAVSKMMRSGYKARDYLSANPLSIGKVAVKFAQDFNRNAENWGRVTHYLYRREYERKGASYSANWVKKAHFDYEELTPAERDKFKMLFPFYTWTRKNIPYQLTQMLSRPGKFDTFVKTIRTSNELANSTPYAEGEQDSLMPSWMRDQYAFSVPGLGENAVMIPQIGIADLAKLEHPKQILNLMNPALKTAYEVGTGRSALTGQKIAGETHPLNPVSGFGAALLSKIPGGNVGETSRVVRGQKMYGPGANPWATYIAGQLPLSNFLVNQRSNIKEAQRGGEQLTDLNYLGGMSVFDRDYEAEMTAARLNFEDQMKKVTRGLRDRGAIPESRNSNQAPTGFNAIIAQMLAGGG